MTKIGGEGSFRTAIAMHEKRNKRILEGFFVRILSFLIFFSILINPIAAFAEETKDRSFAELRQGLEELLELVKVLEKENLSLKQENLRLLKITEQGVAKQVPVLLYHHLYDGDLDKSPYKGNGAVVSVDSFREQMKYLKDNGFYTATLEDLERFLAKEIDLPAKTVVITFDDGYYSNIEYAYPILKEYGQKATIFVVGKGVENATSETNMSSTLRSLGYEDIKNTSDVFEFHSHTYDLHKQINNMPALTVLSKEEILVDLNRIKEQLGTKYLAYPFGGYNENTIEVLKELNYKLAFTVKEGYASPNSEKYEIPRIIVWPSTNIERFKQIVNPR